jgi:hypothetical protein
MDFSRSPGVPEVRESWIADCFTALESQSSCDDEIELEIDISNKSGRSAARRDPS